MLELSIMNHGPRFVEEVRAMLKLFEQDTRTEVNWRVRNGATPGPNS